MAIAGPCRVIALPYTSHARCRRPHARVITAAPGPPPRAVARYLLVQDVGFIGDDGVVGALHPTTTIRRLEFGTAGFTAPMMGVQAGGRWNRSLRASSDRETSSANSCIDASSARTMASAPTATPLATPLAIVVPVRCVHG